MWQILIVGGQTPDGRDATNDLSYLCLDAAAEMQTTQSVLAVRVSESGVLGFPSTRGLTPRGSLE